MNIKSISFFSLLAYLMISCTSNTEEIDNKTHVNESFDSSATVTAQADTSYNQELAEALGADEYGMKKYVMAFLKAGPVRNQDSAAAVKLQQAHMSNIQRLANEGKLIVAGPFLDGKDIRGIYIFDVASVEEAKKLTETDPAIQAGRLVMELHPWYGSAALLKVNEIHEQVAKIKF